MKKKIIRIAIISVFLIALGFIVFIMTQCGYKDKNVEIVEKGCKYIVRSTGEELKECSKIPSPATGDIYRTEDYEYMYIEKFNPLQYTYSEANDMFTMEEYGYDLEVEIMSGWQHTTVNKNKEKYENIAGSIANKPILQVSFEECEKMKKSPQLPKSIVVMNSTYYLCKNLKKTPKIPQGVIIMDRTFAFCENLKKMPTIPDTVKIMCSTFESCTSLKTVKKVPSTVKVMKRTFSGCNNLTGEICIETQKAQINSCFDEVDFEKQKLNLTGESELITKLKFKH